MKTTAICLFLFMAAFTGAAQPAVEVTARLGEDRILPALPVDVYFTVTNRSAQPVEFPFHFVMEVTPAGGEPSLVTWLSSPPYRVTSLPPVFEKDTIVAAGEARTFRKASFTGSRMVAPLPITAPGVYTLRFAFSDELPSIVDAGPSDARPDTIAQIGGGTGLLVSNAVRLEVETPAGVDRPVWEKMQQVSGGHRWPSIGKLYEFSADVWENHRDSRYAPFATLALVMSGASSERVRELREALHKLRPRHSWLEWYELLEGTYLLHEAGEALAAGAPLAEIKRLEEQAEERYQKTLRTTKNEDVVLTARAHLDTLAKERAINASLFESWKGLPRRQDEPLQPLVACGKVSNNETHIVFGYESLNTNVVQVPIGSRNMFMPGEMDRGQPVSFRPGRHENAFRVKAKGGGALTWQLDGTALTVEPGKIRRCSDSEP